MEKKIYNIVLLMIFAYAGLHAQTANTGIMAVEDNTVISTQADFINTNNGVWINDGEAYIYKNFKNDGIVSHSIQSLGLTRFEGTSIQIIDGEEESEFKDILFFNTSQPAPFELNGKIKVNGTSEFNQGIVQNRGLNGGFLFTNDGIATNTWNGSHVDGPVFKLGSSAFTYPVGHSNFYRFCAISAPQNSDSNFEAVFYYQNSDEEKSHVDKDASIELINDKEFWKLNKIISESNAVLTLSWDENTTPSQIYTGVEEIIIVTYDEANHKWIDLGGIVDINNKTVTTPVELSSYGYFTTAKKFKVEDDCVEVFNVITPITKDGLNDYFKIDCLDKFPDNSVEIYNRWGVLVFETTKYGLDNNVFEGYSEGRATVGGSGLLPTGTYFYVLKYTAKDGTQDVARKKVGYLYLNAE